MCKACFLSNAKILIVRTANHREKDMKKLIDRWKAETPQGWKRVKSIALIISGTCSAIWATTASLGFNLDTYTLTFCKYAILAGLILSAGAQLQKVPDEKV